MAHIQSVRLVAIIGVLWSTPVVAGEVFSGGQVDNKAQYIGYMGIRVPLASEGDRLQPFIQMVGLGVGYAFRDQGRELNADLQAVSPSLGLKYSSGPWSLLGTIGPQFRWMQVEQLPGRRTDNTYVGVFVQGEAFYWHDKGTFHIVANYTDIDGLFWSRARGTRLVYKRDQDCCDTYLGWDLTGMGNRDFYAVLTGPLVQIPIDRYWITVRGGYQYTKIFHHGVYGGLELYFAF